MHLMSSLGSLGVDLNRVTKIQGHLSGLWGEEGVEKAWVGRRE